MDELDEKLGESCSGKKMDVKTIVMAVLLILQSLGLGVSLNRADEVQTKVSEVTTEVDKYHDQIQQETERHHSHGRP